MVQVLPATLLRFRRLRPGVQVHLRDMPSLAQEEALQNGEIDLGFVRLPLADPGLRCAPVLHERMVAALGAGSEWSARAGLASLAGRPFVACSRAVSASYRDHVHALCRVAGFEPRVEAEVNDLFSVLQLVRAGVGVALVPGAAAFMRVPGVRFEKIRVPEATWDIGLARRRPSERDALVEAFAGVAAEVCAERPRRPLGPPLPPSGLSRRAGR